jgi:hypothetical protein
MGENDDWNVDDVSVHQSDEPHCDTAGCPKEATGITDGHYHCDEHEHKENDR